MADAGMGGAQAPVKSSKIDLTFPDGATREFPAGTTGLEIAGLVPSPQ